jgi:viologen exporter family transport system ATP-binding protein
VQPYSAVELHDLSKSFRQRLERGSTLPSRIRDFLSPCTKTVPAVDRLNFSIVGGERVALVGPAGAGKSTTVRMLTGVLRSTIGCARVLGFDPSRERRSLAFHVGAVFGPRSQLCPRLPARHTLRVLAYAYDIERARARRRIDALSEQFGLGTLLNTPVRELSAAERIRCELAAILLHEPRLVLLDDLVTDLDSEAGATIRGLLKGESIRQDTTLLVTSRDPREVEGICDRAIVLREGRVAWDGSLATLRTRCATTKRVTIRSESERLDVSMPGVRTLSSAQHRTELEVTVSLAPIDEVVARAIRSTVVRHVAIDDAPVETVTAAGWREWRR